MYFQVGLEKTIEKILQTVVLLQKNIYARTRAKYAHPRRSRHPRWGSRLHWGSPNFKVNAR